MKLFICEKPSQARDIAKVLGASKKCDNHLEGNGVKVTWCLGHLLELAPPDDYQPDLKPWRLSVLPVVPENWKLHPKEQTKDQLKAIKDLVKEATDVVIATDADREGDVIGRELLDYFNYKGKVQRLWLSALDDASIKKALDDIRPGESTFPLYQSGLGRQRADWVIGMNMTMATTCLYSKGQGTMSVGRVQTPTLNLVVERDRIIEDFKPKDYFDVKAGFKNAESAVFQTTWEPLDDLTDEEGRVIQKQHIDNLMARIQVSGEGAPAVVSEFKEAKKKTRAPLCFALSSLQKIASSKFGFSAKDTLAIAQSLYEKHKATTYPRTDCGYLPESQFNEAKGILESLKTVYPVIAPVIEKADFSFRSEAWNDKKVTAHHGIIPTLNQGVNIKDMSADELKLYDLICRYYLAQFLGDYEYSNRSVEVTCEGERFKASSSTPLVAGWKDAISAELEDNDDEKVEPESLIPALSKGEAVHCVSITPQTKQTRPPSRFTEGTLIDAMKNIAKYVEDPEHKKRLKENAGIGTEATRANILELLVNRDYLSRNKKQLISTEKGRRMIELAPDMLKNPVTTSEWEAALDEIAQGRGSLDAFLAGQTNVLRSMVGDLKAKEGEIRKATAGTAQHPCPKCGQALQRKDGKFGVYWSCSGYPECSHTMKDKGGVPVEKKVSEKTDVTCTKCNKGKMTKREGKKGIFYGCSNYPACKNAVNKLDE